MRTSPGSGSCARTGPWPGLGPAPAVGGRGRPVLRRPRRHAGGAVSARGAVSGPRCLNCTETLPTDEFAGCPRSYPPYVLKASPPTTSEVALAALTRWVLAHKKIGRNLLDPAHVRRPRRLRARDGEPGGRVLGPRQGGLGDQPADREELPGHRRRHVAPDAGDHPARGGERRLARPSRPTWRSWTPACGRRSPAPGSPPMPRQGTTPSSRMTGPRPTPSSTRRRTRTRSSARTPRPKRRRARWSPARPSRGSRSS